MSLPATNKHSPSIIWFDAGVIKQVTDDWFEPEYWRAKNKITGSAEGRGTTFFIHHNTLQMVLRHYRRGGLIGRFVDDQYCFTGLHRTRAWRELHLLNKLQDLGLPAPRPLAARVTKSLGMYRADIITEKIPGAVDMHNMLCKKPMSSELWTEMGATIAKFHINQIYHHDLNIHNVMVDEDNRFWLIDFDKCEQRTGEKWKVSNLDRLRRSLDKERGKHPDYAFEQGCWDALLQGYNQF